MRFRRPDRNEIEMGPSLSYYPLPHRLSSLASLLTTASGIALDGWAYPKPRDTAGEAAMECVATAPRIPFPYTESPARNGKLWLLWYLSRVYNW